MEVPDGEKNNDCLELISFPALPMWTPPSISFTIHVKAQNFSSCPPPPLHRSRVHRAVGALDGYSLSMSLYFFLSMDTWSLKSTGSSLI